MGGVWRSILTYLQSYLIIWVSINKTIAKPYIFWNLGSIERHRQCSLKYLTNCSKMEFPNIEQKCCQEQELIRSWIVVHVFLLTQGKLVEERQWLEWHGKGIIPKTLYYQQTSNRLWGCVRVESILLVPNIEQKRCQEQELIRSWIVVQVFLLTQGKLVRKLYWRLLY